MKYWVQFLDDSTGYVPGSIPPKFDKSHVKLIDVLGTDGVHPLDGRLNSHNMNREALKKAQRMEHFKKFKAYQIVSGPRFFDESRRGPVHVLKYPVQVS